MKEYLLVWDGINGYIISGNYKLQTSEKFPLSFGYTKIYYEPSIGNSFIIDNLENARNLLTSEIEEIKKLCDSYYLTATFPVYAYSDTGLYEGRMLNTEAQNKGYNYRVNEIPEFEASKWVRDKWERIIMTVLDDGSVIYYPDNICEQCVLGFTQEEMSNIPDRPSMYHTWDIVNNAWKDPRTLEQAKIDAESSLRADFELVRHYKSDDKHFIPGYESETWTWQYNEAINWLNDNTYVTPYIDTFLSIRTDNKPSKIDLCNDIVTNHISFISKMAEINGNQWNFLSRVKEASTVDECINIQEEAHTYCENIRNTKE